MEAILEGLRNYWDQESRRGLRGGSLASHVQACCVLTLWGSPGDRSALTLLADIPLSTRGKPRARRVPESVLTMSEQKAGGQRSGH